MMSIVSETPGSLKFLARGYPDTLEHEPLELTVVDLVFLSVDYGLILENVSPGVYIRIGGFTNWKQVLNECLSFVDTCQEEVVTIV
jgi:hypothetical protein